MLGIDGRLRYMYNCYQSGRRETGRVFDKWVGQVLDWLGRGCALAEGNGGFEI
ncbi:MAG: hypothetical protein K8R36_19325 [Planctomycetales bacterium]|nr:hypothetical protein [Planctomycetales bacterium]